MQKKSAKGRGIVYLTFDDGPSQYTPAVLETLRATHSTATFFELGFRQAEHPARPPGARRGQQHRQSLLQPSRSDQAQTAEIRPKSRADPQQVRAATLWRHQPDC